MRSKLNRNVVVMVSLIMGFFLGFPPLPSAQEKYPSKNIELIIPWGPGGLSDVAGRIFANELSKVLSTTMTPINKPGASGILGSTYVAFHAKKDGYTLMSSTQGGVVLVPLQLPEIPFDIIKDFVPISIITISPSVIMVRKDSPLKSLEDLVSESKKSPGKLKYATSGIGITEHLNVIQLESAAKIKVINVPFSSGGENLTATLGGHVDFGCIGLVAIANQLKAGAVRGLAIGTNKRLDLFPDIPTFAEKGYSEYFFTNWSGVFAAAGVPRPVVDTLIAASEKVIKSKEYVSKIEATGAIVQYMGAAETRNLIEKEKKIAEVIIKERGLVEKK